MYHQENLKIQSGISSSKSALNELLNGDTSLIYKPLNRLEPEKVARLLSVKYNATISTSLIDNKHSFPQTPNQFISHSHVLQ